MSRIERIRSIVKDLYEKKDPNRADWADWLYPYHVLVVAAQARALAEKYHANSELAEVSALLHDIADAFAKRSDPDHEIKSLETAREILTNNNFSSDEISIIVDDALQFHSCHDDQRPTSSEGKVLATADSYAHLKTDFYLYAMSMLSGTMSYEASKQWALNKIERDYHQKILFDEEREGWRHDYDILKEIFSR